MDLQELSQWMKDRNLKGHWEHSEWSQTVKPFLWKGDEIMQALNWSGELITTGEAGRRTIQMRNPGLAAGMTNTVHISVQLVKPGEVGALAARLPLPPGNFPTLWNADELYIRTSQENAGMR